MELTNTEFVATMSEHPDAAEAVGETIHHLQNSLSGQPSLLAIFVSVAHREHMTQICESAMNFLKPQCLLATISDTVICGPMELESRPSIALWGTTQGHAQGVRLTSGDDPGLSNLLSQVAPPEEPTASLPEPQSKPPTPQQHSATLLLLADPFTFHAENLLDSLTADRPNLNVVGGLVTGAHSPGVSYLCLNGEIHRDGAIGALVSDFPEGEVRSVVSQGCHPIGNPFTVTKAESNFILELGGRPALMRLRDLVTTASDEERRLMRRGLHAGIAVNESHLDYTGGDFLIRGIIDLDRETGAVAIGGIPQVGDTIQFHVRDAKTADADLRKAFTAEQAKGALLFTCNGRGTHMFGQPHHDAGVISQMLGGLPLAGMSCAGEIGPVGAKNYLHGFTASVALFG